MVANQADKENKMCELFGEFGDTEIKNISVAMGEIMKTFKHIGCLVDIDKNDRPRVKVSILSWVPEGCIISARVANRLAKIVSKTTGRDYRWSGMGGGGIEIKEAS